MPYQLAVAVVAVDGNGMHPPLHVPDQYLLNPACYMRVPGGGGDEKEFNPGGDWVETDAEGD